VTLEASAVVWAERYRQGMAARLQWLEGELAVQEAELEKVRLGYLEASRRRKVMDKLKERQSDAARRAATREEIAVLNDIATSRSVRWGEPAAEDRQ
jgi:flagellar export protein FliJ